MIKLFYFFTSFKIVRYLISGGFSAGVTIGTVYLLTEVYAVWYVIAAAVGFVLAVAVNFTLQKFWTFKEKTLKTAHKQYVGFSAVNGINFFLNEMLVVFFVEHVGFAPFIAQFFSAIIIALESFFAYSFIFKSPTTDDALQKKSLLDGKDDIVHAELESVGGDV